LRVNGKIGDFVFLVSDGHGDVGREIAGRIKPVDQVDIVRAGLADPETGQHAAIVDKVEVAVAEINGGSRSVPCEKIRKTAPHCPDGFMQQTCHTISQVQNFFQ